MCECVIMGSGEGESKSGINMTLNYYRAEYLRVMLT